jgi:urease accessory protein UreE
MRGEHEAAREQARAALDLATLTASERQKRRLRMLLASGERSAR